MFLKSQSTAIQTREIARAVGCRTPKEINPTLYEMQKKSYLTKVTDIPPSWRVSDDIPESVLSFMEKENQETEVQQYYQMNRPTFPMTMSGDSSIPVFQETSLFNADVSFDSDYSDLLDVKSFPKPDEGLFDNMTHEDDATSTDHNEGLFDNMTPQDGPTSEDRDKEGDNSDKMNVDQSANLARPSSFRSFFQLDESMSDDDEEDEEEDDFDDDDEEEEEEDEEEEDNDDYYEYNEADEDKNSSNAANDSSESKIELAAKTTDEKFLNIDMFSKRNEDGSADQLNTGTCMTVEAAESNLNIIATSEGLTTNSTGDVNEQLSETNKSEPCDRDLIENRNRNEENVVQPLHDGICELVKKSDIDTESSSLMEENPYISTNDDDNVQVELEVLPNELLEKLPLSEDSTDDDKDIDDNDYNNAMEVNEESELSDDVGESLEMNVKNQPNDIACKMEMSQVKDDINENRNTVEVSHNYAKKENTSDTKDNLSLDADGEKLLQAFTSELPMASFVLKRKSELSEERLTECLQDLERQGIVLKKGGSWQLTVGGRMYLKSITNSNTDIKHQNTQVQHQKPHISGPPPSPMAILQKGKEKSDSLKDSSPDFLKQTGQNIDSNKQILNFNQQRIGIPGTSNSNSIVQRLNTDLFPSSANYTPTSLATSNSPKVLISLNSNVQPTQSIMKSTYSNRPTNAPVPLMSIQITTQSVTTPRTQSSISSFNSVAVSTNASSFGSVVSSSVSGTSIFNQGFKPLSDQTSSTIRQLNQPSSTAVSTLSSNNFERQVNQAQSNVIKPPFSQPTGNSVLSNSGRSTSGTGPSKGQTSASSFKPPLPPADLLARNLQIAPKTGESSLSMQLSTTQRPTPGTQSLFRPGFSSQSVSATNQIGNQTSGTSLRSGVTSDSTSDPENMSLSGLSRLAGFKPLSQATSFKSLTPQSQSLLDQTGLRPLNAQQHLPNQTGFQSLNPQTQSMPVGQTMPQTSHMLSLDTESFAALNKNPVSALMEYAQSRKMTATVELVGRRGSSHKPT